MSNGTHTLAARGATICRITEHMAGRINRNQTALKIASEFRPRQTTPKRSGGKARSVVRTGKRRSNRVRVPVSLWRARDCATDECLGERMRALLSRVKLDTLNRTGKRRLKAEMHSGPRRPLQPRLLRQWARVECVGARLVNKQTRNRERSTHVVIFHRFHLRFFASSLRFFSSFAAREIYE